MGGQWVESWTEGTHWKLVINSERFESPLAEWVLISQVTFSTDSPLTIRLLWWRVGLNLRTHTAQSSGLSATDCHKQWASLIPKESSTSLFFHPKLLGQTRMTDLSSGAASSKMAFFNTLCRDVKTDTGSVYRQHSDNSIVEYWG